MAAARARRVKAGLVRSGRSGSIGAHMPVPLQKFSGAVEKLYAASVNRERWTEALFAIEELTGSAGAIINLVAKTESDDHAIIAGQRMLANYDEDAVAQYNADLVGICPRVAVGVAQPDLPYLCDHMILSEAQMDRDPVYDWYTRQGVRYFIGSTLGESDRFRLMWSLQRSTRQGHVQSQDVELFGLLKPHVQNAVQLADRLGTLTAYRHFTSAIVEALPQALFALSSTGVLVFANGKARQLLSEQDGLRCSGGRLETFGGEDDARLDGLIAQACAPRSAPTGGSARIRRPSGRPDYLASVWPLGRLDAESIAASASALILVHDPTDRFPVRAEMLVEIYGLTGAEARLTTALSQGHSVESAAGMLQIEVATARTHLKAVFRKMGLNRQQDLVRLLASMPLMHRRTGE